MNLNNVLAYCSMIANIFGCLVSWAKFANELNHIYLYLGISRLVWSNEETKLHNITSLFVLLILVRSFHHCLKISNLYPEHIR